MSRTILAQVDGFTPIIDSLVEDVGIIGAAVFGRMWRFCQMENGVCHASLETIGQSLHLSARTVMRHSDQLVAKGYLKDMTPDLKNVPHTYADTGKASIQVNVTGMTKSHSDYDKKSQPAMTKSHMKKGVKKESKKDRDPNLEHPAVIAYRDHAHLTPNQDQRSEIVKRVGERLDSWIAVISEWMLSGYRPQNVAGMLDAFDNGGLRKKYNIKPSDERGELVFS